MVAKIKRASMGPLKHSTKLIKGFIKSFNAFKIIKEYFNEVLKILYIVINNNTPRRHRVHKIKKNHQNRKNNNC